MMGKRGEAPYYGLQSDLKESVCILPVQRGTDQQENTEIANGIYIMY